MHPILASIFSALGLGDQPAAAPKRDTRQPNSTKAGPGRKHHQGDGTRTAEQKRAGAMARGMRNVSKRKNLARCKFAGQHDAHGAITYTGAQPCEPWQGQTRRVWLGGISAMRGY